MAMENVRWPDMFGDFNGSAREFTVAFCVVGKIASRSPVNSVTIEISRIVHKEIANAIQQPLNPGLTNYPNFVAGEAVKVVLSPDGKTLAAANAHAEEIELWDLATVTKIAALPGHTGGVSKVLFSPDGQTLASTGGSVGSTWVARGDGAVALALAIGVTPADAVSAVAATGTTVVAGGGAATSGEAPPQARSAREAVNNAVA